VSGCPAHTPLHCPCPALPSPSSPPSETPPLSPHTLDQFGKIDENVCLFLIFVLYCLNSPPLFYLLSPFPPLVTFPLPLLPLAIKSRFGHLHFLLIPHTLLPHPFSLPHSPYLVMYIAPIHPHFYFWFFFWVSLLSFSLFPSFFLCRPSRGSSSLSFFFICGWSLSSPFSSPCLPSHFPPPLLLYTPPITPAPPPSPFTTASLSYSPAILPSTLFRFPPRFSYPTPRLSSLCSLSPPGTLFSPLPFPLR